MPKKDMSIEGLRCFAIVLVVAFHIANDPQLRSSAEIYHYLSYTFENIRMPLFTMLSGYLYGSRPATREQYGFFVTGKMHRLLLPMVVVATLQYIVSATIPGVNNPENIHDLWRIYFFPYEHYWFVQSIFLIFLTVGIIDSYNLICILRNWIGLLLAAIIVFLLFVGFNIECNIFGIGGSIYLFPFFLLGLGFTRFPNTTQSNKLVVPAGIIFLGCFVVQQFTWFLGLAIDTSKASAFGVVMGIAACTILFRFKFMFRNGFLASIGGFAYAIYLYQAFGAGIGRRLAGDLLDLTGLPYFILTISITLAFGVFVEVQLRKTKILKRFLLGLK